MVLLIGVGLGANAVLVAVADALFLQPLPYQDGERIALDEFWQRGPGTELNGAALRPGLAAVSPQRRRDIGVAGEPVGQDGRRDAVVLRCFRDPPSRPVRGVLARPARTAS
jgi:hypothetical protein